MSPNSKISTGSAGEYFVAAELERRGFTVAMPMANTPNFDILAIDRESQKQVAIQVKTTRGKSKEWTLSEKNEDISNKSVIYIFVALNGLGSPEYHIVPSEIVADSVKKFHQEWLATPGAKGQPHKDNNMRHFSDDEGLYLNKWENLYYWE